MTDQPTLKAHADEMAKKFSDGLGIPFIEATSLCLTLLRVVIQCWMLANETGDPTRTAGNCHRMLKHYHDADDGFRPGLVTRTRRKVRRVVRDRGLEPTEEWVEDVADDLLTRGLKAELAAMEAYCREGWQ